MTGPVVTRALVDGWVEGWSRCRGAVVHRLADDVVRVDVADRHRAAELVLWPAPPDRVVEVATAWADRPRHWLTLVGGTPATSAPDGWRVRTTDEVLMVTDLSGPGPDASNASNASDPSPRADEQGATGARRATAVPVTTRGLGDGVVRAEVGDDGSWASGLVGVVGTVAVFDQIATDPAHRRQGLGRAVMAALATAAREAGARTGVLFASVEGQALYASLGWTVVAPLLSLETTVGPLRERLRVGLRVGMRARDRSAVAAIRSALAAVDNAEAVPLDDADDSHRAGAIEAAAVGLGAAEVARRELTEDDVVAIVRREVDERRHAIEAVEAAAPERAATIRAEVEALTAFLD